LIGALAVLLLLVQVQTASAQGQLPPTIDLLVPAPPVPASAGGQAHLVYELHVTNLAAADILLTRVDVVSEPGGRLLVRYATGELNTVIDRPGLPAPAPGAAPRDLRAIAGGQRGVVRIWVSGDPSALPSAVRHRVFVETTAPNGAKIAGVVESLPTEIRRQSLLVLDPPFSGGTWYAGNAPSNSSPHRRTLLAVNGRARIAQRFAIDWIKLGDDGLLYKGDPSKNASWYAYGEAVLAAADGVVTEVKDGIPDNTPLATERAVPITLDTVAGNYVIIEHERGRYALYAHLQPKSLRVKVGNHVRRGQVLGRLGNSGNSDAPHVHFHLCDASSALGCEGLPYVINGFEVLGHLDVGADLRTLKPWSPRPDQAPDPRAKEIPLEDAVVRFAAPSPRP